MDREAREQYSVVIQAKDMAGQVGGLSGSTTINITLTDVNDNPPKFPQKNYQLYVPESAQVGKAVGKIKANDDDIGINAEIKYSITNGDGVSVFAISTDKDTREGIISLKRQLNYEKKKSYTLHIEGANTHLDPRFLHLGPFKDTTTLKIIIGDVDEPPAFSIDSYVMNVSENAKIGTEVGTVTAQDPDSANSAIRYFIDRSLHGDKYFNIDANTGAIKTAKKLDREDMPWHNISVIASEVGHSSFCFLFSILRLILPLHGAASKLKNWLGCLLALGQLCIICLVHCSLFSFLFFQMIPGVLPPPPPHCVCVDNPSLLSHVSVMVQVLDVNDNPPELASDGDVVVCENSRPGQVIQTIRAVDKDDFANGPRFHFSLTSDLPSNPNFTLKDNEDNTASIFARRRKFSRTTQDLYHLPIVISDGGDPNLSSTSTLTLRVCACEHNGKVRTCHAEAFLSSAGLSTGALIAILLCVIILLAIVVLFITLRRSKKEPLIISEEDVRENVVTYDDEGGGEEDTEAFDIIALRNPAAAEELKFRRDVRPEVQRVPRQSPPSVLDNVDVQEFIKQRLIEADLDTSVPPYDSLQTYAYEGHGSPAGSISSLDSATTHSEQDYTYLCEWGPEFQKLAELYGESDQTT
ncbi:CADH9 protein, partial [Atractosteus spatula]|nr:CADH9 protein [Atractosteus spatula]